MPFSERRQLPLREYLEPKPRLGGKLLRCGDGRGTSELSWFERSVGQVSVRGTVRDTGSAVMYVEVYVTHGMARYLRGCSALTGPLPLNPQQPQPQPWPEPYCSLPLFQPFSKRNTNTTAYQANKHPNSPSPDLLTPRGVPHLEMSPNKQYPSSTHKLL